MTTVAPNPHSPYATANPEYRHIFAVPAFLPAPEPGGLLPTACEAMAVVSEEVIETRPGAELPDGVCLLCVAVMNGGEPPARPSSECGDCGSATWHGALCALCRQERHEAWWPTRNEKPAVWVEGDPLMEAIATAVHDHCDTGDGGIVHDDPRNIAAAAASVARAIVLREAADEAQSCVALFEGDEDDEGNAAAGAMEGLADRFRRMADEQPTTTKPRSEACAHCGKNILRITGTLTAWWVHDPGGHTACNPGHAADSPRATPQPAAGVRQDGAQPEDPFCICSHPRSRHLKVSGRLLCDACDPNSTDHLVCKGFDAL